MWKRTLLAAVLGISMISNLGAQTVIPGGSVSGTWGVSGSPYIIEGEITVPSGDTLIIEAGVEVNFQGHYKLIVQGLLDALGTQTDSILFTAADPDTGWHGIRFINSPDSSHLLYCLIQYGRATGVSPDNRGGGIYCQESDPVISHCTLVDNSAGAGGGIACNTNSSPTISHCTIRDNAALSSDGGGIYCWQGSNPTIRHCIIAGNTTGFFGGGVFCGSSANPIIDHCTISRNSSSQNGGGINCYQSSPIILNAIIEGNAGSGGINIYTSPGISITYCDVYNNQGGNFVGNTIPPGLGIIATVNANGDSCDSFQNIYKDPLFEDPVIGNFQITWANYPTWDQTRSPCIDAGNLDPQYYDPDSTVADIGALYFDQSAFPPEPEIAVSTDLLDFGSVTIGNQANLPLTIYNHGNRALTLYDIHSSEPSFSTNFDPADSLVFPADSLLITVYFDPQEATTYDEILSIENSDSLVEVSLQGVGLLPPEPEITMSADTLDFGTVMVGDQSSLPLTIYNTGDTTLVLYSITTSEPSFSTDFDPADSLVAPGDSLLITVTFAPAEAISYDDTLSIDNNDQMVWVSLQGMGLLPPEPVILVSADSLDFGSVLVGDQSDLPLTIYNVGDTTLVLYGITTSEPSFSTDFDPADSLVAPGDSLLITVTFAPAAAISYNDTLSIENNDQLVHVSLQGVGVPREPEIAVSADSLDFGSVLVGDQSDLPLTIYNVGDTTLVLYSITSSEPSFSTDFDPADSLVAPGDSLLITVTFTPDEIDAYSETLTIENNDQTAVIRLLGEGIGPVALTLTPLNPPIVIPENGGSFDFNIAVENLTGDPQTFDLWTVIHLPEVGEFPVLLATNITITGGFAINRDRIQQVPGYAPGGTYQYWGYLGTYPWVVEDHDLFTFEKEGDDREGSLGSPSDWFCSGEPFPGQLTTPLLPENWALQAPFPNPFNATTNFMIALPEAARVTLSIYDISGRRVAQVIDGWREAGYHTVTFDGSELASGVYIYRLQSQNFSASGKMVLLK